jgi:ribosomal protein S18 acetylase RimI-like enzyme
MDIIIKQPKTDKEFKDYYDLRWRILRQAHGQPRGSEKDDLEELSIHLMVYYEGKIPAAVGRVHLNSKNEAQIRFMAVEPRYQNSGIGSSLLADLEKRVRTRGASHIVLNSRESAVGFYLKNGYVQTGEAGILFGTVRHMRMRKDFYPVNKKI